MRYHYPVVCSIFVLSTLTSVTAQNAMKTATTGTPRAEDNPSVAEASSTASAPFASGNVVVRTTVHVDATTESVSTDRNSPTPFHASAGEILGSAGTYGDFSRYLQLFPGVV